MGTDLLSDIRREIDARLTQLRPALAEYEQLLDAAGALGLNGEAPASAAQAAPARKPPAGRRATASAPRAPRAASAARKPRAARGAASEAILGVLEHGSHTVGELAVVTAMSATTLNGSLRKLATAGLVAKTQREGKAAWSLISGD